MSLLLQTPGTIGFWGVGGVGVRDLAGLTEPHLPHQRAEVYWPEELDRAPVHALYLHGRWPQRTGLNDQVLGRVGYVPVCRRGTDATAPTLWVHRQCDLLLAPPEQAVVEQWCELGARASKAR